MRFGRGMGGQSWSGLGWSGFVRSEFRPPDKRPSIFFSVPASPEQGARDVRSAASKGQICPVTGLCEVPWWVPSGVEEWCVEGGCACVALASARITTELRLAKSGEG